MTKKVNKPESNNVKSVPNKAVSNQEWKGETEKMHKVSDSLRHTGAAQIMSEFLNEVKAFNIRLDSFQRSFELLLNVDSLLRKKD